MAEYTWASWVLWGGIALVLAALIGSAIFRRRRGYTTPDRRNDQWPLDHSGNDQENSHSSDDMKDRKKIA